MPYSIISVLWGKSILTVNYSCHSWGKRSSLIFNCFVKLLFNIFLFNSSPFSSAILIKKCSVCWFHQREEGVDIRKMMEPKRTLCSVDQSNYTPIASKRHKADLSISTKVVCFPLPFFLPDAAMILFLYFLILAFIFTSFYAIYLITIYNSFCANRREKRRLGNELLPCSSSFLHLGRYINLSLRIAWEYILLLVLYQVEFTGNYITQQNKQGKRSLIDFNGYLAYYWF